MIDIAGTTYFSSENAASLSEFVGSLQNVGAETEFIFYKSFCRMPGRCLNFFVFCCYSKNAVIDRNILSKVIGLLFVGKRMVAHQSGIRVVKTKIPMRFIKAIPFKFIVE
ncbi:hypothetical protein SDC9_175325 [bioreactor metagenome]|uniref:Uncharacterized protein n=1 Tax=bioreactor metagenome TaxID=1076179 RepID=A0A645GLS0_9ZZZZ